MIKLQEVNKVFPGGKQAVTNVSLQINKGQNLAILGTSGSGKTTVLKMINRLIEPSSGKIYIDNEEVSTLEKKALRMQVGYVFQNIGLFPHYTVGENIAVTLRMAKTPEPQVSKRVSDLMEKLHLDPSLLRSFPRQLSGGQQQRVGLARALANNPPILLMDEPFGALDPITRANVRKEFLELDELNNKTIVLVTHDVDEAFELGDDIAIMHNGAVVQVGSPKSLLFCAKHQFVENFLQQSHFVQSMKAVRIQDIAPYVMSALMQNVNAAEHKEYLQQQAGRSLWDILEQLPLVGNKDAADGASAEALYAHLLSALTQYKIDFEHGCS